MFQAEQHDRHSTTPHDQEEDEEECRVCRGPAEEGRPLFKPCKCSGSIGLTHQDCLTSWLEVKAGSRKCDLCQHTFQFAPRYASDAPETLSKLEVGIELCLKLAHHWIPFVIRLVFVCFIWLGVMPLCTAYIYQGWMHRPSSVIGRMTWDMVGGDLVNGCLLTVINVVGFLSIMSLIDFFRLQWDKLDTITTKKEEEEEEHNEDDVLIQADTIEDDYKDELQELSLRFNKRVWTRKINRMEGGLPYGVGYKHETQDPFATMFHQDDQSATKLWNARQNIGQSDMEDKPKGNAYEEDEDDDDDDDDDYEEEEEDETDDESAIERMMQLQEEDDSESNSDSDDSIQNNARIELREEIRAMEANIVNIQQMIAEENRVNANVADERMDAFDGEMVMEFENLIGLRGPISTVLRNLTWILAFQTSFIFLFCCVPCIVGSIFSSILSKNALIGTVTNFIATKAIYLTFDLKSRDGVPMDWTQTIRIINEENERLQTLIQPRDVSLIVFGYLTYAVLSFSFSGCIGLYTRYFKGSLSPGDYRGVTNLDEMNANEIKSLVLKTLTVASKCASAASKISLLVCFKMFALPLILGIWLDLSTLQLFGANIEDRLASAGADLIVAFILHWVVGITFMLTITVSILQLREVLHPDLLAPIIRPQEPQPDLLLQLLQDSGWVHLKRMIPSVAIYASLLCIHVWLPCRLLRMFGAHDVIPLFRPKFWHIINPGLQSAIELFCFHLAILSVLEKQKNAIGLVQHKILMKLSNWFGLTKSLLPFATSKSFALVGEVQLLGNLDEDHVDRDDHDNNEELLLGLSELYKKRGATDLYLESKVKIEEPSEDTTWAENIITPDSYIVIAPKLPHSPRKVMRTHMGKYRFRKRVGLKGRQTIEIWREVATEPIPRPPEDWDYLADDNNVDKGRWAWGTKEKKSEIERNVASRELIFPPVQKNGDLVSPFRSCQGLLRGLPTILKLASIALVSWVFATIFSSFVLFGPLIIGRFISHLLHVPNEYIHDPFLFFVGCIFIAPAIISFIRNISTKDEIQRVRGKFLFPPFKKQLIMFETLFLWLVVCPLFIGVLYDTFLSNESLAALLQAKLVHMMKSWVVGFLLLHLWGAAVYCSAFRRKFWSNVRTLAMEGIAGGRVGEPNRNNNRMVANNPRPDINAPRMEYANDHLDDGWQGDDGRVGKFLNCIHSAFWMFEWDKMDKDILLEKTLYPIVHNVLTAIVIPMAIFLFTTLSFGVGVIMYRASITIVLLVDMFIALKEPLKKWYISAHKAARDHRYLIGKVLLNYEHTYK